LEVGHAVEMRDQPVLLKRHFAGNLAETTFIRLVKPTTAQPSTENDDGQEYNKDGRFIG
jgi:hypothetical protein